MAEPVPKPEPEPVGDDEPGVPDLPAVQIGVSATIDTSADSAGRPPTARVRPSLRLPWVLIAIGVAAVVACILYFVLHIANQYSDGYQSWNNDAYLGITVFAWFALSVLVILLGALLSSISTGYRIAFAIIGALLALYVVLWMIASSNSETPDGVWSFLGFLPCLLLVVAGAIAFGAFQGSLPKPWVWVSASAWIISGLAQAFAGLLPDPKPYLALLALPFLLLGVGQLAAGLGGRRDARSQAPAETDGT